jgi:malonyl CoA-acyl carrier protein transacylase
VSEKDRIKADIEATRAELAETADALAAHLDVKAQASKKMHQAGQRMGERVSQVRDAPPEPVQKAIGKTEQAVSPVLAKAAADKKRTLLVLAGTAVVLIVVRRVRNRKQ